MADWRVSRVFAHLQGTERIWVFEGLLAPLTLAMAFLERGCKKDYTTIKGIFKTFMQMMLLCPPLCLLPYDKWPYSWNALLYSVLQLLGSMNETFSLLYISCFTTKGCPNVAATGENFHLVQTGLENQQVSSTPLTEAWEKIGVHHLLSYVGWNAPCFR